MPQQIYIMEGPDGVGKTEIGNELSNKTGVPYFKMTTEHENWRKGAFKEALRFDQTWAAEFLRQTGYSAVLDRMYPSEWVYSKVFNRETDEKVLAAVDRQFSTMKTKIIVLLRRDYSVCEDDEVVPKDKLVDLHNGYLEFIQWTRCQVVKMYVDDFENDLKRQMPALKQAFDHLDFISPSYPYTCEKK